MPSVALKANASLLAYAASSKRSRTGRKLQQVSRVAGRTDVRSLSSLVCTRGRTRGASVLEPEAVIKIDFAS